MSRRSAFDVDKLCADIEAGRTILSIADECDCSRNAVRAAMRREGIVRPERHLQARHPELVDRGWLQREYVDKRRSLADLARQFGCDRSTIRDYLVRAGIPTRGQATDAMPPELRSGTGLRPPMRIGQARRSPANSVSVRPLSDGRCASSASKSTQTEAGDCSGRWLYGLGVTQP